MMPHKKFVFRFFCCCVVLLALAACVPTDLETAVTVTPTPSATTPSPCLHNCPFYPGSHTAHLAHKPGSAPARFADAHTAASNGHGGTVANLFRSAGKSGTRSNSGCGLFA